jgi:hypothetical protein
MLSSYDGNSLHLTVARQGSPVSDKPGIESATLKTLKNLSMKIRLQSVRSYFDSLLLVIGLLIIGGVIAMFMKGYTWLFELIPVGIVIFVGLSNTYTTAITLIEQRLEVEYVHFMRKKVIAFNMYDITLRLEYHIAYVGRRNIPHPYYLLKIFEKDTVAYVVNSQEGFSMNGLADFVSKYNAVQRQQQITS